MPEVGLRPDEVSYTATISACAKEAWWETALDLLAEMKTRSITPSVASYTAVIDTCARGKRCDHVFRLLDEMVAAKREPNVITFNAALLALALSEDPQSWQRARALFGRMEDQG
eukprot:3635402-Prymnesium_polylepis.1